MDADVIVVDVFVIDATTDAFCELRMAQWYKKGESVESISYVNLAYVAGKYIVIITVTFSKRHNNMLIKRIKLCWPVFLPLPTLSLSLSVTESLLLPPSPPHHPLKQEHFCAVPEGQLKLYIFTAAAATKLIVPQSRCCSNPIS